MISRISNPYWNQLGTRLKFCLPQKPLDLQGGGKGKEASPLEVSCSFFLKRNLILYQNHFYNQHIFRNQVLNFDWNKPYTESCSFRHFWLLIYLCVRNHYRPLFFHPLHFLLQPPHLNIKSILPNKYIYIYIYIYIAATIVFISAISFWFKIALLWSSCAYVSHSPSLPQKKVPMQYKTFRFIYFLPVQLRSSAIYFSPWRGKNPPP